MVVDSASRSESTDFSHYSFLAPLGKGCSAVLTLTNEMVRFPPLGIKQLTQLCLSKVKFSPENSATVVCESQTGLKILSKTRREYCL